MHLLGIFGITLLVFGPKHFQNLGKELERVSEGSRLL